MSLDETPPAAYCKTPALRTNGSPATNDPGTLKTFCKASPKSMSAVRVGVGKWMPWRVRVQVKVAEAAPLPSGTSQRDPDAIWPWVLQRRVR
eukprot:scaffold137787_cov35-Prasinocladus_malaysianus.AAC.1